MPGIAPALPPSTQSHTLYVGGSGPGNYTSIQDAIDDAMPGDTIFVYSGIYTENLEIFKSISIKGEDAESTIIEGNESRATVFISSEGVDLSNFTIKNAGNMDGITMYRATNCRIFGCEITDCGNAIFMNSSSSNLIKDCDIVGNRYHGIFIGNSTANAIENVRFFANSRAGIYIYLSEGNVINHCYISYTGWGGVYLWGNSNVIENCIAHNCPTGFIIGVENNSIINCTSYSHRYIGIFVYGADGARIERCEAFENGNSGIRIRYASSNVICNECHFHNNSIGMEILQASFNIMVEKSVIADNGLGIYVNGSNNVIISTSNIYGNGKVGIYATNGSVVDARNNYWGTIFGPLTFGLLDNGIFWRGARIYFFPWSFIPFEN